MSEWPTLFLAAIAAATGVMALIQIGVVIYGARLARQRGDILMCRYMCDGRVTTRITT